MMGAVSLNTCFHCATMNTLCPIDLFSDWNGDRVEIFVFGKQGCGKSCFSRLLNGLCLRIFSIASPDVDMNSYISIVEATSNCPPSAGCMAFYIYDICDINGITDFKSCNAFHATETTTKYLIGNKIDLEYWRKVDVASGRKAARDHHSKFCEVSCLTGLHVDIVVDTILKTIFPQLSNRVTVARSISDIANKKRRQDEDLDQIQDAVDRLHGMKASLNVELQNQTQLLDHLDSDMEFAGIKKSTWSQDIIGGLRRSVDRETGANGMSHFVT